MLYIHTKFSFHQVFAYIRLTLHQTFPLPQSLSSTKSQYLTFTTFTRDARESLRGSRWESWWESWKKWKMKLRKWSSYSATHWKNNSNLCYKLRDGVKNGNFWWHLPWRGGVWRGSRVPHTYFEKWFFQKPFRIIPWLWKRVLHLVWALYYVYILDEMTLNMAK